MRGRISEPAETSAKYSGQRIVKGMPFDAGERVCGHTCQWEQIKGENGGECERSCGTVKLCIERTIGLDAASHLIQWATNVEINSNKDEHMRVQDGHFIHASSERNSRIDHCVVMNEESNKSGLCEVGSRSLMKRRLSVCIHKL